MDSFRKISFLKDYSSPNKVVVLILVLLILVVIGAAGTGYYFFSQYKKAEQLLKNPDDISKSELKKMLTNISKFIELPTGEEPNVATVIDKEKLKDQPFFIKAENGDKVIIYTQAKKAILYRPKTNKVIDITVVNIGSSNTALETGRDKNKLQGIRVALLNGTKTNGLTRNVEKHLKEKLPEIEIVVRENAKKDNYTKTLIIPISEKSKDILDQFIKTLGGEQGKLPDGESKPDVDIAIILGTDYKTE